MGRKCAVPHCYTGYKKCAEKASLYKVPDDEYFLKKWQEAICREDRQITPRDYICRKHFKKDDILRMRTTKHMVEAYQRLKLRPDAIPSIFPDLPDSIPKMVKKRRKLPSKEAGDSLAETAVKCEHDASMGNLEDTKEQTILSNVEIDIKAEVDESIEFNQEKEEVQTNNVIVTTNEL